LCPISYPPERLHFDGVWNQAAEGAPIQQDIIKTLTPHPQGLTETEILSNTGMDETAFQNAIKTLKHRDVVECVQSRWKISVELFRVWVSKYHETQEE
jgi:transcription initiation factor IIE alpha subunit